MPGGAPVSGCENIAGSEMTAMEPVMIAGRIATGIEAVTFATPVSGPTNSEC